MGKQKRDKEMTGAQLVEIAKGHFGSRGWQAKLAAAIGRDVSSIRRWVADGKVPKMAAGAIRALGNGR